MRRQLIAGNWKMNYTASQARSIAQDFVRLVASKRDVDILLIPNYVALSAVQNALVGTNVELGAQDLFWLDAGAYTGKISAPMLLDVGVKYCVVGHSETRGRFGKLEVPTSTVGYFAESDETINLKIRSLINHSIRTILCVGETLKEREDGDTEPVIREQVEGALDGIDEDDAQEMVIAYEPVWAIGTGQTCEANEAERVCGFIRSLIDERFSSETASRLRVLYGGSVKPSNAEELFGQTNIDGGLVGGASLMAEEFSQIVFCAAGR